MKKLSPSKIQKFKEIVTGYYQKQGRHDLPWRPTTRNASKGMKGIDPYIIWVSEIMLQQTQVDRVVPFFKNWMKKFPTIISLANASQTDILKLWKGLGYNSRALRMKQTAQTIVKDYKGRFPADYNELQKLPGIGPYTAGAICAFAYNQPITIIETNIRRVFLRHFFEDTNNVHDNEILDLVTQTLDTKNPQTWYWALMDYGSYLGRALKLKGKKYNPNIQSRHYTKQSKFIGSDRQIRGKILEILLQQKSHKISFEKLVTLLSSLSSDADRIEMIIDQLEKEYFIEIKNNYINLKK